MCENRSNLLHNSYEKDNFVLFISGGGRTARMVAEHYTQANTSYGGAGNINAVILTKPLIDKARLVVFLKKKWYDRLREYVTCPFIVLDIDNECNIIDKIETQLSFLL